MSYGKQAKNFSGGLDENADHHQLGAKYASAPPSRHGSPPPMTPLHLNRHSRSASRAGSRGADETPLCSPMPCYPRRSRSVTFLDDDAGRGGADDCREERPFYHTSTMDSASKPSRSQAARDEEEAQFEHSTSGPTPILVEKPHYESDSSRIARTLPTPRKQQLQTPVRRAASRQRLETRRQQAMLEHDFYDDSFVEEFVSKTKEEITREEQEREQAVREETRRRLAAEAAANRASETRQQLTERNISQTNSSSSASEDCRAAVERLLKELQGKSFAGGADSALALEGTTRKSIAPSVAVDPKPGHRQRQASVAIPDIDIMQAIQPRRGKAATATTSTTAQKSKEQKLEKIIREAMVNYKRSKKKRSVMLIDLNDIASDVSEGSQVVDESEVECFDARDGNTLRAESKILVREPSQRPLTVQGKKRQRSERSKRQDSRPQLDDSSDDDALDDSDASAERPLLLNRGSRQLPPQRAASTRGRRLEPARDSVQLETAATAFLPRAAPPPLPRGRKPSGRGRGKRSAKEEDEPEAVEVPSVAARAAAPAVSFVAPRAEPMRAPLGAAFNGASSAALPHTAGRGAARGTNSRRVDPDEPFANCFFEHFDSPQKFDELVVGAVVPPRRNNGNSGLVLPGSYAKRR